MTKKTVSMKREYMKPEMQIVELQTRNHLLVGSDRSVKVYEENYDEDNMDDLQSSFDPHKKEYQ